MDGLKMVHNNDWVCSNTPPKINTNGGLEENISFLNG